MLWDMGTNQTIRYEVDLPDGRTVSRCSKRTYTHAVITEIPPTMWNPGWGVVGYCGSAELANKRASDWRSRVPEAPCQVVEVRAVAS